MDGPHRTLDMDLFEPLLVALVLGRVMKMPPPSVVPYVLDVSASEAPKFRGEGSDHPGEPRLSDRLEVPIPSAIF